MNDYERIKHFICSEPRMKPFLDEAKEECYRSNCQSWVAILNLTIENLLDAYESKCNDIEFLEQERLKHGF